MTHIFLVGPAGSGKDTLANELQLRGYFKTVSWTTRPMRKGETQGNPYIFVKDDQFDYIINNSLAVAVREYKTVYGTWKYGVNLQDIRENPDSVTVIDPKGYKELREYFPESFGVFLDLPKDICRISMLKRGDHPHEIDRRERADDRDFAESRVKYSYLYDMRIGARRDPVDECNRILFQLSRKNLAR